MPQCVQRATPVAKEPDAHLGALLGVLGRVVEQRPHGATQRLLVRAGVHALLELALHRAPPLEGHRVELERAARDELAHVDALEVPARRRRGGRLLVGAREGEQVLDKPLHVVGLVGGAQDPAPGVLGYAISAL